MVLLGKADMPIPQRPDVVPLGFLPEEAEKFDAIAASSVVVLPSPHESLSMVNLEAWMLGTPVLANASCEVLVENCTKANGGLYYGSTEEFVEALDLLLTNPDLRRALGEQGREYANANYSWPAIERKYLEVIYSG